MRVLISGSSGLVGSALRQSLAAAGDEAIRLIRPGAKAEGPSVSWDPEAGRLDAAALEGLDAVVHLAGENIAEGRWTEAKKRRIRRSRVEGTRLLSEALVSLARPPRVLLSASAIGYYGDRGAEVLTENSPPGSGFLPEVCQAWEKATEAAARKGIRVVCARFGVILSPAGGALKKMLVPFRLGMGGVVGSGDQQMSWISLQDAVGAIQHALRTEALSGPLNTVAPQPVTNRAFTRVLASVLSRPAVFPVPAFAIRLLFGEMGDAALLASVRVKPERLQASGYRYRHSDLETALRDLLDRSKPR
ncbi:MAG TPA: TIGR01777 family oxidoreductase [Candidatus Polarisedimenticolia bacterium]|jgi:hypothetical protein|nr:TIGR01777 family oxidoreductase [Candidatus Polarisedimenticolia bacterium]